MAAKKKKGKAGRRPEPNSKSGKIRAMLGSGMSAGEIAKKVGCTVQLVYNIKSQSGKGGTRKGKRGRKPKSASAMPGDLAGILDAVKNSERERVQLRAALEKIQAVINDALG